MSSKKRSSDVGNLSRGNKRSRVEDDVYDYSAADFDTAYAMNLSSLSRSEPSYSTASASNSRSSSNLSMTGEKTQYSSVAQKLMKSMGYVEGSGLGAHGMGRVEPVEASQQRGRRGLGHKVPKADPVLSGIEWTPENEHVSVEEKVMFMNPCSHPSPPSAEEMRAWLVYGPRKEVIDDETMFCDEKILKGILSSKDVFDHFDNNELMRARSKSNPYETIGKVFFQNRAALKMANLDAITDFMFTNPKLDNNHSAVLNDEVLFFADVCAAPGGFAEYAIWRRKDAGKEAGFPDVHGYGFTLRSNDFKLQDFFAAPRECFEPHYGENGKSGDGDIYKPGNVATFCSFVKKHTMSRGVHFMMADGGFSVEGQENIQEILSKQLYLGQFTVALGIVREGGHFVCKLFDIFTPFSVGLIYLMYRCFNRISIHKPNTSRPANSERYIICQGLRSGCNRVYSHLFEVNEKLGNLRGTPEDITELVPYDIIAEDSEFLSYIIDSNNSIGRNQIMSLQKIQIFAEEPTRMETRQSEIRTESLAAWKVPDRPRTAPWRHQPALRVKDLLAESGIDTSGEAVIQPLTTVKCLQNIHSIYDFRCVVLCSSPDRRRDKGFFLGLGNQNVFRSDSLNGSYWERVNHNVELPPDTLIYAEFVEEITGMSYELIDFKQDLKNQRRVKVLHIIDAIVLNGYHIGKLHLTARHELIRKFCLAVNKPSRPDLTPVRCKDLHRLEHVNHLLCKPSFLVRQVKNDGFRRVLYCEDKAIGESFHVPSFGLLLLPIVKAPWMMAFSKSAQKKYFYNVKTKEAKFELPDDSVADFGTSYKSSLVWHWTRGTQVAENDKGLDDYLDSDEEEAEHLTTDKLHLSHFIEKIIEATRPAQR